MYASSLKYFLLTFLIQCVQLQEILRHPDQITSVEIGSSGFIHCGIAGTHAVPHWKIIHPDGHILTVSSLDLPPKHIYNGSGILITNTDISLNGTMYICYLYIISDGKYEVVQSRAGTLLVNEQESEVTIEPATPVSTNIYFTILDVIQPTEPPNIVDFNIFLIGLFSAMFFFLVSLIINIILIFKLKQYDSILSHRAGGDMKSRKHSDAKNMQKLREHDSLKKKQMKEESSEDHPPEYVEKPHKHDSYENNEIKASSVAELLENMEENNEMKEVGSEERTHI